jgi:hypothetical protein
MARQHADAAGRTMPALDDLLAEYAIDRSASVLPAIALELLRCGYESLSLAALVAPTRDQSPPDLHDLFARVLHELGLSLPDLPAAAATMKRRLARQVVEGSLSPREGAEGLVGLYQTLQPHLPKDRVLAGDGLGIARILGCYYAYDDPRPADAKAPRMIDEEVRELCERLATGDDVNE